MHIYAKDTFSKDAAARFLGFSPPTIQRWTEAGNITVIRNKQTGKWFFKRADLERFAVTAGIDLDDAQRNPPHYSVNGLAKQVKIHFSKMRRLIDCNKLSVIHVNVPGAKNEIVYIGHAVAQRFIASQAKANKAG